VRIIRALDEPHDRAEGRGADDGLGEEEIESFITRGPVPCHVSKECERPRVETWRDPCCARYKRALFIARPRS